MVLLPSTFEVSRLKHAQVIASGAKSKRSRRRYEENKTNIEDTYLSDGWVDSTQIWNRRFPTLRALPQQNWLISVQALLSYQCMKTSDAPIPLFHYRSDTDTFEARNADTDPIPILCPTSISHKKQLVI